MSNHYRGMSKLRNAALNNVGFLRATAERVQSGDIRLSEIVDRLNDSATILERAEQDATELYHTPEPTP